MAGLVDAAAVYLSKWGGERETKGGSELAGLGGWAFFVSNRLFDAGWSFYRCAKQEVSYGSSKRKGFWHPNKVGV
jgi:hypothetical protein